MTFQLPRFEGPLALLLYLIRKEEMDILDIPIQKITAQYLEYLKIMKELDLEVAGEFISMAATLLHIKSRMLLPQYDENGEVVEVEDPRKELVNRLLEYERFQQAARDLYDRPLMGRDFWVRGVREELPQPEEEVVIEDNALFQLIASFRRVMLQAKKGAHEVAAKIQSISSRILELRDRLVVGTRVSLRDLVSEVLADLQQARRKTLITFLSLLELGRLGFVKLSQLDDVQEIWVDPVKSIETDVISRVEDFGGSILTVATETQTVPIEEDDEVEVPAQMSFSQVQLEAPVEEMASDDDILQAEQELGLLDNSIVSEPDGEAPA